MTAVSQTSRPYQQTRQLTDTQLKGLLYKRYSYLATRAGEADTEVRSSILRMEATLRDQLFFKPLFNLVKKKGDLAKVSQEEFFGLQLDLHRKLVDFYTATGATRIDGPTYINCLDHALLFQYSISTEKKIELISEHLQDADKIMSQFKYKPVDRGVSGDIAVFYDDNGKATHYARVVSKEGEVLRLESTLGTTGIVIQHSLEQTLSTYGDVKSITFYRPSK